jgi:predicted permease
MKTSVLIDILRFPAKKTNNLNAWYRILWSLFFFPFVIVFGIGFYIAILAFTLSPYRAEQFRKEYMITL